MVIQKTHGKYIINYLILLCIILSSCSQQEQPQFNFNTNNTPESEDNIEKSETKPFQQRPIYSPGELVDYIAQTGDTLPALALHFNTNEKDIRSSNIIIPKDVTTLPSGLPMKIPIFYMPLWGNSFQIIPDNLFIYGPSQVEFDTVAYVQASNGWLKTFQGVAGGLTGNGGELVQHVAVLYSISPQLLLAILEFQTGALSRPDIPDNIEKFPLGLNNFENAGFYQQLVSAANILNNGYYGWRTGSLKSFEHQDGKLERPDPWQNAATIGLSNYLSKVMSSNLYVQSVSKNGFIVTYKNLFGDPWENIQPHIPGSLVQPSLLLPFQPGKIWAYTGGPHTGWGEGEPFAALDFAPPGITGGCTPSIEWVIAVADGVVVRTGNGLLVLDLDGDQNENTGWVIFYLHLTGIQSIKVGDKLKAGTPIGHPSCEGGNATGTHIHIARKYNGEWIPAGGALAFDLEGWKARVGEKPYLGTLEKFTSVVQACTCSDNASQLQSFPPH